MPPLQHARKAGWLVARSLPGDKREKGGVSRAGAFLRRPRTRLLMACFGLVNGAYSTAVAWLAPFYRDLGWSAAASGSLLAVMAVFQAGAALFLPILAGKREDRRPWLWLTLAIQAVGFATLALRPEAAPLLCAAILGAGLGGCFALSMIVALDHLPDAGEAGALSTLMQGGGFLLAALPPLIVVILDDLTGGFTAGWVLHLCCVVVVAGLCWRMAPAGYASAMDRTSRTSTATECGLDLPTSWKASLSRLGLGGSQPLRNLLPGTVIVANGHR